MSGFKIGFFIMCYSLLFTQESMERKTKVLSQPEIFQTPINIENKEIIIQKSGLSKSTFQAEFDTLVSKCTYYKTKLDFEGLMVTANSLYNKAKVQNDYRYQAIAKYYLFEAYLFNDFPKKALQQLDEGMHYIVLWEKEGKPVASLKKNFYIGYSNYYLQRGNLSKQLKFIKLSGSEIRKMPEGKGKRRGLYIYYSNLAQVYNGMHRTDSAKYYSSLSNSIGGDFDYDEVLLMNLQILGEAAMKDRHYKEALDYFKAAEEIKGQQNHINQLKLYDNIINAYQKINKQDSAELYRYKKDSLRLKLSENQKEFLHKLIDGLKNDKFNTSLYIILTILLAFGIFIGFVIRRNRVLAKQEKLSSEYLQDTATIADEHERLINMVKENNPALMEYFYKVYPAFQEKLLDINPKITHSEEEFCALLKLRMPTKEIAKYKFIAPKTVQNKKHLIRKKLKIPKGTDIYHWFGNF